MRRRRKESDFNPKTLAKHRCEIWKRFSVLDWWICSVCLAVILPHPCSGVHVFVRDEKRYAVLFQSVVLPCQYNSVSTQIPVVQWIYKSYCRDRTRDSFSFSDGVSGGLGGVGGGGLAGGSAGAGGAGYETGAAASYLDCADSSRTVRTVASISGSSVTLSEYYKNRDISIINKADLRIGEVQWGDSGVYICKVVISDDLEGQNEASVELLVLEWVFVAAVALGSVLFLLLLGVCWCQCCPHSCCCYVSCWCCPDTCCCPRHLYEAGKRIKSGTSTPQSPTFPPYFVSGVPTMVPIAPPSLVDKISSVPPSDGSLLTAVPMHAVGVPYRVPTPQDQNSLRVLQYVEKQLAHFNPAGSTSHKSCSMSELSSLHEGEAGFRQTYRNVQKKALPALPAIPDDGQPEPQRFSDHCGPEPQRCRDTRSPEPQRYSESPRSPKQYRDERDSEPRHCQDETPPPRRRHSDDPPPPSSSSQARRHNRTLRLHSEGDEETHNRWNPRSEHLQRKAYHSAGRAASLDELEEFTGSYKQRQGRSEERLDCDVELLEFSRYPTERRRSPQNYYSDINEFGDDDGGGSGDRLRRDRSHRRLISPIASPKRSWAGSDGERPVPPPPQASEMDYDAAFLSSLLERKARLREVGQGRSGDSDTPSKGSSRQSSGESGRHRSRLPGYGAELADPPPPAPARSEAERHPADRLSPRPAKTRPDQATPHSPPGRRDEPRDRSRKVGTLLSRDSLIV
ncbi:immunoglobulin-like domain-containing receptor 2 isoform X2 [Nelusetta ayraudi]|uniref:immunoglobulin-like domain-containing receptor 2 isoform X2 n=1 Tax=Nelusetta ayraudi TaxID=303726 RepID=UPI003F7156C5